MCLHRCKSVCAHCYSSFLQQEKNCFKVVQTTPHSSLSSDGFTTFCGSDLSGFQLSNVPTETSHVCSLSRTYTMPLCMVTSHRVSLLNFFNCHFVMSLTTCHKPCSVYLPSSSQWHRVVRHSSLFSCVQQNTFKNLI